MTSEELREVEHEANNGKKITGEFKKRLQELYVIAQENGYGTEFGWIEEFVTSPDADDFESEEEEGIDEEMEGVGGDDGGGESDDMGEREKIDELFNELKSLLANYPNNRVDFEFDEYGTCCWNGEEFEPCYFIIYYGSDVYDEEKMSVTSIYVEDDKLYFDCIWTAFDVTTGDECGWDVRDHVEADFLYSRSQDSQDIKTLIEALEFFIDILQK